MIDTQRVLAIALLVAGLALTACSPEAARTRSGGPGADIGNRGPVVNMHGAQSPYYQTPRVGMTASRR
jgi:hypothetical protein